MVTFQEHIQGWLSWIVRAKKDADIQEGYARLLALHREFCRMNVLPFEATAQHRFVELRRQKVRISTLDLRIACVALAHDAILLTANKRDFEKVPDLRIENWTLPS